MMDGGSVGGSYDNLLNWRLVVDAIVGACLASDPLEGLNLTAATVSGQANARRRLRGKLLQGVGVVDDVGEAGKQDTGLLAQHTDAAALGPANDTGTIVRIIQQSVELYVVPVLVLAMQLAKALELPECADQRTATVMMCHGQRPLLNMCAKGIDQKQ